METTSLLFVVLNSLFAAVFALSARSLLGRRGSPILMSYAVVTLVFVYALPVQDYSSNLGADVLLLSHMLLIIYLVSVLILSRRHAGAVDFLVTLATKVPSRTIVATVVFWLAVRLYLAAAYGPASLAFSRAQLFQSDGIVTFSTLEMALSSITTMLLLGALVVVVLRQAAGQRGNSAFVMAMALFMLVLIVVSNESPIGSRRLLLVLAALWLAMVLASAGMSLTAFFRRNLLQFLGVAAAVAILAVYYQQVRNNDFTEILRAQGVAEVVKSTVRFATTFDSATNEQDIRYLRSGPFDFFAKVVDVSFVDGKSSNGDAALFSFALAVPKLLYSGEKPVGDVDEVLHERLQIEPSMPYLNIDYSTSLPAIAVADFGLIGIIPAALLLGFCFVAVGLLLRQVAHVPLAVLLLLGLSVQLIGSQETGLTAIVSALRDASLMLLILLPGHWLVEKFSNAAKAAVRRQAVSVHPQAGCTRHASGASVEAAR